ncbi:L-2-amino-thiazoline-4-carboxylic acid hydrolase [Methylobacterium planeticum]|uniref:L-2-amino-thiazoline-4-carboxylic acid hydrolase n=1 Tax=Methylobacterium planeticum TaxID=2615211 RepID=A0A6N6MK97_9HYPH|nr:L-2-amino-thiazoline-4-carboxylic acid hydrolase [Methylobacterium planeticum]KAB1070029.1 L-2-amino-thiazoline-4-carboxylic acid hydrolase [Methylobacterium planeticum]
MSASLPPTQSIENDVTAIEDAIVSLGRIAKSDAARRGKTLMDNAEAETFRNTHSKLAALIADPVNEVCYIGMEALRIHLQQILPPDEVQAVFQRAIARLAAEAGQDLPDRPRIH